jgi:hypothetical protein
MMGTNYYLHEKADCECCGRPFEQLHIGKSSGGWCFSLHVIPEEGINTIEDWIAKWSAPGVQIRNEYNDFVEPHEMLAVICDRRGSRHSGDGWDTDWWKWGYSSEEHFHSMNHSLRGPNGLLRHQVDGRHCIGQGEGTWDYITGEFS